MTNSSHNLSPAAFYGTVVIDNDLAIPLWGVADPRKIPTVSEVIHPHCCTWCRQIVIRQRSLGLWRNLSEARYKGSSGRVLARKTAAGIRSRRQCADEQGCSRLLANGEKSAILSYCRSGLLAWALEHLDH